MTYTYIEVLLLACTIAILFAVLFSAHQILSATSDLDKRFTDLDSRFAALAQATRLLAGLIEMDKTQTTAILDEYLREKSESRL